ncbi:MAG: chromate transporter, partial [Synergistaceae bacterium]
MMMNLIDLIISFAKTGCVGYGGGPSMVPLFKKEIVEIYRWMDAQQFMDMLAIGNALPGPIATKISAATGYIVAGPVGSIAAMLANVAPSVIALIILIRFVNVVKSNPKVASMLKGLRPVVVAMLAYAAYDLSFGSITGLT